MGLGVIGIINSYRIQHIFDEFLEKALPAYEGEVRKWKDGDYKFEGGKWKKIKLEEKSQKLPSKLNQIGNLEFDYANQTIKHGKDEYSLTLTENSLLKTLVKNKDKFLTRTEIMKDVWGNDNYENISKMDVYLTRLRKLFRLDPSIQLLNTYGMGFKLVVTPGVKKEEIIKEIKPINSKLEFSKKLGESIKEFKSVAFDGKQLLTDSKRDKKKIENNLIKTGLDKFFSTFKLEISENIWISNVNQDKFNQLS
jgi:DNA-binding winged helix-turn-helix (wHTH) protein